MSFFEKDMGFCTVCGTILPHFFDNKVVCLKCKTVAQLQDFTIVERKTSKTYNKVPRMGDDEMEQQNVLGSVSRPTLERQCRECGNNKMYYHTQQTRSADEGQTVFYTCTDCGFREMEFS